jgi:hypothetical protein
MGKASMQLNKICSAKYHLSYKTQAAFPPYEINFYTKPIPGYVDGTYHYQELVLLEGLPSQACPIHGIKMINVLFSFFKNINSIVIPKDHNLTSYVISRSQWKTFEFQTCDFNQEYWEAKIYERPFHPVY